MLNRKGVNGIVTIVLLLFAFTGLTFFTYDWFDYMKSDWEVKIKSTDLQESMKISKVDGTRLYLENDYKNDLLIKEVKIGDKNCFVQDVIIDKGSAVVDIGTCNSGFDKLSAKQVSLVTDYGVYSENEALRNPIENAIVFSYQTDICDISAGYQRLFSLSSLDNSHVNIDDIGTYRMCIRSLDGNLKFDKLNSKYKSILYLIGTNNSAVWLDNTTAYQQPSEWNDIGFYVDGGEFDVKINSSKPAYGYVCLGAVDRDDAYGSHFGDCSSSMPDKIWLSLK